MLKKNLYFKTPHRNYRIKFKVLVCSIGESVSPDYIIVYLSVCFWNKRSVIVNYFYARVKVNCIQRF